MMDLILTLSLRGSISSREKNRWCCYGSPNIYLKSERSSSQPASQLPIPSPLRSSHQRPSVPVISGTEPVRADTAKAALIGRPTQTEFFSPPLM